VVVCPHDDDDGCGCRKPKPGMLIDLAKRWHVSLSESFVVGDSWKDIEAGRRAGCRTILVGSGDGCAASPDAAVPDLTTAAAMIESYRSSLASRLR
jgi:D-glycero-D-manno-heptose 1,7-bisphosphate phosphatase